MFSHNQLSELITAIKGRGEIPLKFNYIGKVGTKRWDALAKLRGEDVKGINKVEANLLSTKANDFLHSFNDLKKLNIIDIGPGNGFPVTSLLDTLNKNGVEFRYVPIDISEDMLEVATKNVKNLFPKISIEPVQLDFELGNFVETTYKLRNGGWKNLLVFLGTTLGNQSDRSRILTNFRDSMTSEDFLIIGVELVNLHKIDKLLEQYHVKQSRDFTFTTAEHVGINNNEGEFEERFNSEINAIEAFFNFNHNVNLKFEGEEIIFEKGDRLLLGRSHKFTEWIFAKTLTEAGYRIEILTTSSEKGYSLVMCQPQRFNY